MRSTLSINWYSRAIDGPRHIRGEESDYIRNRTRFDPFGIVAVGDGSAILRRVNRARHDAIDVDVRRLQLVGEGFGQTQHGAFRRAVGGVSGTSSQTVAAGDVDNCAATLA